MQYLPPQSRSAAPALIPPVASACRRTAEVATLPLSASTPTHMAALPEAFIHDARNLLTALSLYADLLHAPGVLCPDFQHYAAELRYLADRSSSLLNRVLPDDKDTPVTALAGSPAESHAGSVSSWRVGARDAQFSAGEPLCDPAAVLRRFMPLLQAQIGSWVTVDVILHRPLPALPVNAEALERIVSNLVCNAAEAMRTVREGVRLAETSVPMIWVVLDARDGVGWLSVEDSGPGMNIMTAAALELSRFPRLGGARPGHGMGLQIVDGLVRETGGRVSIRRRPLGTTVTIQWPLPQVGPVQTFAGTPPVAQKGTCPC